MKISLTGRVTLEIDDRVIDEAQLPGRQGRLLFVYLVVAEGRPVPRHELADVLWGDAPPATWEKALTVLASKLRRLLPDPSILTAAFGCYRIELPHGTSVDVVEAAAAENAGERALEAGALEEARVESERAVSLLVRPFLPGEDGDWVEARRRALAHVREQALATLAEAGLRAGDTATAGRAAEQLIGLAPLRESGYRRLMQAHAAAGNRAEALSVYERCRQVLVDELGAYPSPETEAIYRTLLDLPLAEASAEGLGAFPSAETDGSPPASPTADPAAFRARGRPRRIVAVLAFAVLALALAGVAVAFVVAGYDESGRLAMPGDAVAALDERGRISSAVTVAGPPSQLAVVDDSLWVGTSTGVVRRVALERETVVESVRVGESVDGLAASEDAVWATSAERGAVVRISPETGDVVQTIDVPNGPRGIAVGEGAVWVASLYARTLSRIEPRSGLRVWVRPVGGSPIRVAVGAGSVWLSNESDAQVTRVDPRTGRILQRIGVGNAPGAIATGAGAVWVANTQDGTVSRIDPATNTVVALVSVGDGPTDLAVSGERVWVANELAGTVVAIDPATNDVVATVDTAQRPTALALAGERLWIGTRDASIAHRGGTLRVAKAVLEETIDQVDYSALWSLNLTGDGLTAYQHSGTATLVPDLAVSIPTPTDAGRTYTFQVRRGVRYSNGETVGPADFRRAIERLFRLNAAAPPYYDAVVGAEACRRRPATCDLSKGIVADEGAWTVTFRLTRPEPNLLHALALPFAHAVAPSAPRGLVTSRGLPATGPYVLSAHLPGRGLRLVRNPRFREWSRSARPDGYPDEIVVTDARDEAAVIRGVEQGRFDVGLVDRTDAATLDRLVARYPDRVRLDRTLGTLLLALNTTRPPFDSLAARRAVAHALDRGTLAHLTGGPRSTEVACQLLPPDFPAFERTCPFGSGESAGSDDGTWRAPDLTEARRLIDRSGTAGARVVVRTWPLWAAEARHVAGLLRELGYRASARISSAEEWLRDAYGPTETAQPVQIGLSGWLIDYVAPSTYFDQLRCGAIDPSRHCDPAIDRLMDEALALQPVDLAAADVLWAKVDRKLTDRAAWIAYGTPRLLRFLGPRAGNYQAHPVWGTLVDQLWVR